MVIQIHRRCKYLAKRRVSCRPIDTPFFMLLPCRKAKSGHVRWVALVVNRKAEYRKQHNEDQDARESPRRSSGMHALAYAQSLVAKTVTLPTDSKALCYWKLGGSYRSKSEAKKLLFISVEITHADNRGQSNMSINPNSPRFVLLGQAGCFVHECTLKCIRDITVENSYATANTFDSATHIRHGARNKLAVISGN